MANMDRFVGYDYANNPITEQYYFHGDARYTARSEEAADLSNWNMMLYQNQYNSPSEQVKRLEEAGLNPLFYLANNAGTIPAAQGGQAQGHQMTGKNGSLENLLQAANTVNAAVGTGAQMRKIANDYEVQSTKNDIDAYNAATQRKLVDAQIPKIQAEEDYYNYYLMPKTQREIAQIDKQIDLLVKDGLIKDEQVNQIKAQTDQLRALESYYYSQVSLNYTQEQVNHALVKYYGSQGAYYNAIADPMARELEERAGFNKENARKVSHEATKAIWEGDILSFQSYLLHNYGKVKYIGEILDIYADAGAKGTQALLNALDFGVGIGTAGASRVLPGMRQSPGSMGSYLGNSTTSTRNPIGFGN